MANRYPSLVGNRFGTLTVLAALPTRQYGYRIWRCRCDCGHVEDMRQPTQMQRCSKCRTPLCRNCGISLGRVTRRRTCSPECRRELTARLAQESRARLAEEVDGYAAARTAYNVARLAANPTAAAAKRASDKRYRKWRQETDPTYREAKNTRSRALYDEMRQDPAWLEAQRLRAANKRRRHELDIMAIDIAKIEEPSEK